MDLAERKDTAENGEIDKSEPIPPVVVLGKIFKNVYGIEAVFSRTETSMQLTEKCFCI